MAKLVRLEDIRLLETVKNCKSCKKLIKYFYEYQGRNYNTMELVFVPDALYEPVKLIIAKLRAIEDFKKESIINEELRKRFYKENYYLNNEEVEQIMKETKKNYNKF